MSALDPSPSPPGTPAATRRFVLTVQPASVQQAWHAWLCGEDGNGLDFHTPIELLRHLAQLGTPTPPPGRLR